MQKSSASPQLPPEARETNVRGALLQFIAHLHPTQSSGYPAISLPVLWEHTGHCTSKLSPHYLHLIKNRWLSPDISSNFLSFMFSSVAQSCPTLCDPMIHSTPGLLVHHQLPEFTQTHIHWVSDAIQPSHLLSSPSSPAPNPSQHQSLLQWVNSSHEVAKVLEFQL